MVNQIPSENEQVGGNEELMTNQEIDINNSRYVFAIGTKYH